MNRSLLNKKKLKKNMRLFLSAQSTIGRWMGVDQAPDLGFYIPYRYKGLLEKPDEFSQIQWIQKYLMCKKDGFLSTLSFAESLKKDLHLFLEDSPSDPGQPRFNQSWFPGLDGIMAYSFVRMHQPKKIIEIGSGHSTRFLRRAFVDQGIEGWIHSIDPEPRKEVDAICDHITRKTVTDCDLDIFSELQSGDFLFIDCSHIAMPGSDVDYLLNQVLPQLPKGVIVHIHDILLPYGYPKVWEWRGYNEQLLVASLLGCGEGAYEPLWPSYFMSQQFPDEVASMEIPVPKGAWQTSFWLKKNSPAIQISNS